MPITKLNSKYYLVKLKSKSIIIIAILVAIFITITVMKFVDSQPLTNSSNSYLSHTNNNRTYSYGSNNRPYFHFDYEEGFCVDLKNNKLSDMANCKLEDRIENRMLLSDEIPLLRNSKDNDIIIYDLPSLEEKGNRSYDDDVLPELPFPTRPAPKNNTVEKHQL